MTRHGPADGYSLGDGVSVAFKTDGEYSYFFGYYDVSPFDTEGNRLLCHRVDFDGRPIEPDDEATVGYWRLADETFVPLAETTAFNWQQGSRLQWLPPEYSDEVIFNDWQDGSLVSVRLNVETGDRQVYARPIYDVHPSGESALCLNFDRLRYCRPSYGYRGSNDPKWDTPVHPDDGIYRLDLTTGEHEQIIATQSFCGDPAETTRDHWLEHAVWNPSGSRFLFYYRQEDPDGAHDSRVHTAAPDGSDRHALPDTGFYSHVSWKDDDHFTVWSIKPSVSKEAKDAVKQSKLVRTLVRPVYDFVRSRGPSTVSENLETTKAFVTYRDRTSKYELVAPETIPGDGHNSWSSDGRRMLTDTYAEDGRRPLLLYDSQTESVRELARFDSQHTETGYRCDLHPRWDREERLIAVDSAHHEQRQMVVLADET